MSRDSGRYTGLPQLCPSVFLLWVKERVYCQDHQLLQIKFIMVFRTVVVCMDIIFSDPKLLTLSKQAPVLQNEGWGICDWKIELCNKPEDVGTDVHPSPY